ncbi:GGDEF domain-containing protein [Paraliomyxa miuraensis]|uniref:GGDEF domain-containing protein n=1 Tax=Paraliomyxa miuraensis TaxID=376150 RepID=UPI00225AD509|nr:GGDEF domain-containing protein [Paraliomyxa miuraensis]MCX4247758.1 diguanylate cyclase [Paraliomyxa miuraensis]
MSPPPARTRLVVVYAQNVSLLGLRRDLVPSAEPVTIGRGPDNTIVLPDDGTSRHHARIERRDDEWWIVDLGSTNGTYVHDERVESARLRRGDMIRIGHTIIRCVDPEFDRQIDESSYTATPIDGLTQLYTRCHLLARLEEQLEHAGRPGWRLTLALLDIERFKMFNDTHGHPAGDQVLRELAALMRPHVRDGEVLARVAGNVFAVLLPNIDLRPATTRAEAIRTAIETHRFMVEGRGVSLTMALGIAEASEDMRDASELMRAADQQLHADQLHRRRSR